MENEWAPFEVLKEEKKTILRLHGTEGTIRIEADKIPFRGNLRLHNIWNAHYCGSKESNSELRIY